MPLTVTGPTAYNSNTDPGSPPLITNTVGDGITVIDLVLAKGYPTTTATQLTYSAGKVTVNKTSHGMQVGDITSVSGAAEDEYNGRVAVSDVDDADNFKYVPVTAPGASPATGTILFSNSGGRPALGWQLVFTDTNKRVYRPRFGLRFYLRFEQVNTYNVRMRGFITMSDVDNGTEPYPTVAQVANGVHWQVTTNSPVTKHWRAYGDATQVYFYCQAEAGGSRGHSVFFGDFPSFKNGDIYNSILIGSNADSSSIVQIGLPYFGASGVISGLGGVGGYWVPRAYHQAGGPVQLGCFTDHDMYKVPTTSGVGTPGSTCLVFPGIMDGGLYISRIFIPESQGVRGYIRGIWCLCHNLANMSGVAEGDTFSGNNNLSGRDFRIAYCGNNAVLGSVVVETSDTLDD